MRGRVGEVEVVVLDVFAVVAFLVGQSEGSLLEDRVLTVPESNGKTQAALVIADAEQSILTPAVNTRTGMIVGK